MPQTAKKAKKNGQVLLLIESGCSPEARRAEAGTARTSSPSKTDAALFEYSVSKNFLAIVDKRKLRMTKKQVPRNMPTLSMWSLNEKL